MKICLLTFGKYPVPATEGGAVENLIEMMAWDYQSHQYQCSLDIISKYSESAAKRAGNYDKVKFHFVSYSDTAQKLSQLVRIFVHKLFGCAPAVIDPFFAKALKIIRKNKYDYVIVENGIYFVQPLKKHCKSKVVLHLHNDFGTISYHKPHVLIRNSDMMISVSDFVANTTRNTAECKFPVTTVKNVIDISAFSANELLLCQAQDIRHKYGFAQDDVVCLFAGRLIPEKGIDFLIDAIAQQQNDKIKLLVVGGSAFGDSQKTEFEQSLYDAAEKAGGRVVFAGYVDYKNMPAYYHSCDIAIFPSQCPDAAPLVALEAQTAGKPVVASYAGGMPEYVCNESAIMVPMGSDFTSKLADAINTLGASPQLRERMGNAGIAFAAQHDKDGYFGRILDAVNDII